jgi:hypothetical protein
MYYLSDLEKKDVKKLLEGKGIESEFAIDNILVVGFARHPQEDEKKFKTIHVLGIIPKMWYWFLRDGIIYLEAADRMGGHHGATADRLYDAVEKVINARFFQS